MAIPLPAGTHAVTFSATGSVSTGSNVGGAYPANGPDGLPGFSEQLVGPAFHLGGYKADTWGALVGMFASSSQQAGDPTGTADFRSGAIGTSFVTWTPGLQDLFFIGTGQTIAGSQRTYSVPAGATTLYLGVPDCLLRSGVNTPCDPGQYQDNGGQFNVQVTSQPSPNPPPLPPSLPPPPPAAGAQYVALGDSYSSGEGLKDYETGTAITNGYPKHAKGNECHRSAHAYPQLALQHGASAIARRLRACSGGLIDDFSYKRGFLGIAYADDKELYRPEEPAQVLWLGPTTAFVTLSVSGNDLFFAKILPACAYRRTTRPRRPPSQDFIDSCDFQIKRGATALTKIQRRLKSLYTLVLSRAPNAQVRVLSYPMLFPNPKEYSDKTGYDRALGCVVAGLPAFVLNNHVKKFRALNDGLNDEIAAAVKAVRSSAPGGGRLALVDIQKAFGDHTVSCGQSGRPDRPWINAARIQFGTTVSKASFHPNKTGQCQMALAVNTAFAWKDKKLRCK